MGQELQRALCCADGEEICITQAVRCLYEYKILDFIGWNLAPYNDFLDLFPRACSGS